MAPDWKLVLTQCRAGGHVTAQRALEEELVTRNGQLATSEEAKTFLIDRLVVTRKIGKALRASATGTEGRLDPREPAPEESSGAGG